MSTRSYLSLALVVIFLFACGGAEEPGRNADADRTAELAAASEKWEAVMAVHDEVMPKMSNINRISRELRDYMDQHPNMEAGRRESIERTVRQLAEAEEGMWEWMNNFPQLEKLRQEKSHEEIMQFLEEQQRVIDTVRRDMIQAIDDGEQLLTELQSGQKEQ